MKVSICIVAYNEQEYLPRILADICKQEYPHELMELVLVNSMSTDKTLEYIKHFEQEHKSEFYSIQILENPKRILAAGWNVALENYSGDVIVRIDAHASIPSDFICLNVECIETGEKVSGGKRPNIIEGKNVWKEMLLTAESSMFGSSIAPYRRNSSKQYVKSVFHGMYSRKVFEQVGMFNEELGRTEDNEIHYRIRKAGYKICYSPTITSYQYARPTLTKMIRQKYSNGYWIGRTLKLCPQCLNWYHFVPVLFVLASMATFISAKLGVPQFLYILWGGYGAFCVLITFLETLKVRKLGFNFALPIIFLLLHASYGIGTILGILSIVKQKCNR